LNLEIELGGRRRAVDVRREGAAWVVTVDGRAVSATVVEVGGRWSLLVAGPSEAGLHEDGPREAGGPAELSVASGFNRTYRSYEVSFEARGDGSSVVHVNGEAVALTVVDSRRRLARRGHESVEGAHRPSPIVAPMPGRIVKVLVKPGDAVAARQGVVVVEAMKMENELRAPRAGTVTDVRVSEGMSVEANAVLLVVE
jgi:biotin carboxyl carrier protein